MKWPQKMLPSLRRWAGEISPSCREAARLQSEALDHPLTVTRRIGLRIHLLLCKWCRRYGRQLGWLRAFAREQEKHVETIPPQTLPREAKRRMTERLASEK